MARRATICAMHIVEIETFGRGGLTHYAYNLTRALAERGHDVTFLTADDYELAESHLPANARVERLIGRRRPKSGLGRKLQAIYDAFAVARRVRELRPDVVHFHCTNSASLVYHRLLRRTQIPFAATSHVVTPHEAIRLQTPIYRRIHRDCDLIVAHSKFDQARLHDEFAVEPERTIVIPHGEYGFFERDTDLQDREQARASLGLKPDEKVALFFGYIREYKGLDVLLDAWPEVAAVQPDARLVIAGDPVRLAPERRRELQEQAERLGAIHRFEYVPFSDVARYFGAADLLVMPYRHISQSGVLYLALSLGVPVIASRVGCVPEMLEDGNSALIVPPVEPRPLAAALTRALGDPDLRRRLADGGRLVAEAHSWPAVAEQTEEAFARLVGGQR